MGAPAAEAISLSLRDCFVIGQTALYNQRLLCYPSNTALYDRRLLFYRPETALLSIIDRSVIDQRLINYRLETAPLSIREPLLFIGGCSAIDQRLLSYLLETALLSHVVASSAEIGAPCQDCSGGGRSRTNCLPSGASPTPCSSHCSGLLLLTPGTTISWA